MKSDIPLVDLQAQHKRLRREINQALSRVLTAGVYILGPEVAAFEQEFAAYCGAAQAIGVGSGTDALQLALRACQIQPGDEVITVSQTAVAEAAAIEMTGARPVLVDIDPRRYTLDPRKLTQALTQQTRAIVPVHLHGCPADLEPILTIARQNKLFVIEDCAQAHGARYQGRRVGTWGDIAAFSFYPTKNLGANGDGGALVTNQPQLAERVRSLRQYGWDADKISQEKGINSRLDEIQAAILRVKLKYLDDWNAQRRELAQRYDHLLAGSELILPAACGECEPVYHHYVIRHPRRDALQKYLRLRGIQTLVHYPQPLHLQPAYTNLGYAPGSLPESEAASRETLSLPIYPEMTPKMVTTICSAITDFFRIPDSPSSSRAG